MSIVGATTTAVPRPPQKICFLRALVRLWNVLNELRLPAVRSILQVFVIAQNWGHSYFHFLIEDLPRITLMLDVLRENLDIGVRTFTSSQLAGQRLSSCLFMRAVISIIDLFLSLL